MTGATKNPAARHGKLWRVAAAIGAWLQALDYTGFDYTQDRIDMLERDVARLTEEVRESRELTARGLK